MSEVSVSLGEYLAGHPDVTVEQLQGIARTLDEFGSHQADDEISESAAAFRALALMLEVRQQEEEKSLEELLNTVIG